MSSPTLKSQLSHSIAKARKADGDTKGAVAAFLDGMLAGQAAASRAAAENPDPAPGPMVKAIRDHAVREAIQVLDQYRCDMMFPNIDDGQRKRRMERATEVRDRLRTVFLPPDVLPDPAEWAEAQARAADHAEEFDWERALGREEESE